MAEFVAELRRIAQHCEFGTVLEDLLRDRLVCGQRDDRAQRRLLAESKLTFAKAFEIAHAGIGVSRTEGVRTLQLPVAGVNSIPESDDRKAAVNAVNTESKDSQAPRGPCFRCGGRHSSLTCRCKSWICNSCGKKGHVARVCRSRSSVRTTSKQKKQEVHRLAENVFVSQNTRSGLKLIREVKSHP